VLQIVGKDWKEANDQALALVEKDNSVAYVHPYDHPDIWYDSEVGIMAHVVNK
jgi:threonine dehydratase